ncbi:hypothetical protein Tco_0551893, partial [Tanacetum coccineum]
EETEAQGKKFHDLDPLVSLLQELVTPLKTVNASGEEQVEDISPTTLEAAAILTKVKKISQLIKLILLKKVNTGGIKVIAVLKRINDGSFGMLILQWRSKAKLESKCKLGRVCLERILLLKIMQKGFVEFENQRRKPLQRKGARAKMDHQDSNTHSGTNSNFLKNQGTCGRAIQDCDEKTWYEPEDEFEKVLWEYLKNMFEEPLSTDQFGVCQSTSEIVGDTKRHAEYNCVWRTGSL